MHISTRLQIRRYSQKDETRGNGGGEMAECVGGLVFLVDGRTDSEFRDTDAVGGGGGCLPSRVLRRL